VRHSGDRSTDCRRHITAAFVLSAAWRYSLMFAQRYAAAEHSSTALQRMLRGHMALRVIAMLASAARACFAVRRAATRVRRHYIA